MPSKIPVEAINPVISYNSIQDVFQRNNTATKCINPINKGKHDEFLWILQTQTNCIFNADEWEQDDLATNQDNALCICSQKIEHTFKIKHTPTGYSFIVGSECIKKISKSLYNKFFKPKCAVCGCPILDKRTKLGKKNLCSEACNSSVLPFGKYKNQELSTIPVSYLEWLYKQEWVNAHTKSLITYHVFEKPTKKKKFR